MAGGHGHLRVGRASGGEGWRAARTAPALGFQQWGCGMRDRQPGLGLEVQRAGRLRAGLYPPHTLGRHSRLCLECRKGARVPAPPPGTAGSVPKPTLPPQTPQHLSLPSRTREPWGPGQRCPPLPAEQGRAVAPRTMGNCPGTAPPAAPPGREQTGNKGSAVGALGPPPPVCLGRGRRGHGGTKAGGGVPLCHPRLFPQ